jgi:hypothetical protein
VEACNGWDDDCDGETDEGCDRACESFQMSRRVLLKSGGYDVTLANAERSWAIAYPDNYVNHPEHGQTIVRIDRRGERLVEDRVFPDARYDTRLVWTGTDAVSVWSRFDDAEVNGLYQQPLGRWGHGGSDPFRPYSGKPVRINSAIWNGYEFATLWFGCGIGGDRMCLTRFAPDGRVWEEKKELTLVKHNDGSIAWNGDGYGWSYSRLRDSGNWEVYFRLMDRNGDAYGPEVQLTNHDGLTDKWALRSSLTYKGPGRGYGVCWRDNRTGIVGVRCMMLDEAGSPVVPPGEIVVSNTTENIRWLEVGWNGYEFLVAWTNVDDSSFERGKIEGARISEAGEILETRFATDGPEDNDISLAWSGSTWGMTIEEWPDYPFGAPSAVFVEIGCDCATDGDGDGVLPCAGGDCDDSDPFVGAGMGEDCSDGKDNDCDGLVDCNDPDCHQNGRVPGEVVGLVFAADKASFEWAEESSATKYDVARGDLADLREMRNFKWTDCFSSRQTATAAVDTEAPGPGEGFHYLVRAGARTCLLGTWGTAGRDTALRGCP